MIYVVQTSGNNQKAFVARSQCTSRTMEFDSGAVPRTITGRYF